MMFWPSMMSLAPPPVTPSRKFPPRLGVPAAPVDDELVLDEEEPEPHAAARLPTAASPAAPVRSCRRETSVMSWPFCSPVLVPPGPVWVPADESSRRRPHGSGDHRHGSAGGHEPRPACGCLPAPEVRIAW